MKKLGADTRAVLGLVAGEGFYFSRGIWGDAIVKGGSKGTHGFDPSRPNFRASFIASGPGVTRRSSLGTLHMTDVGATIAKALGLRLRDATGKAVSLK